MSAVANSIPVHERMEALSLLHDGARCHGVIARNLATGELVAYVARATCIATGGFGRIYRVSTNAIINEGMGAAIALETSAHRVANSRSACWADRRAPCLPGGASSFQCLCNGLLR